MTQNYSLILAVDRIFKTKVNYSKFPEFSVARKLCCNLPKIQTWVKPSNLRVFHRKDANGIANSEDPDQTAPLGSKLSSLPNRKRGGCYFLNQLVDFDQTCLHVDLYIFGRG